MSFSRVGGARPLLLSFRACGPFAGSGKGTKRGPARKGGNKGVKGGNPYCFSCPINPSSLPPLRFSTFSLFPSLAFASPTTHPRRTPPPFPSSCYSQSPCYAFLSGALRKSRSSCALRHTCTSGKNTSDPISLIRRGFNPNHPPTPERVRSKGLG